MVIAIDGLSLGAIYALIALGYTMVYGIAKMLNFAHGDVIMVGAYMIYTLCTLTWTTGSLPIWAGALIAFVVSIVVCTLLGMVNEKVAYKPLRGASPLAALITAIGVSYLLQGIAQLIWGAEQRSISILDRLGTVRVGTVAIRWSSIITVVCGAILMIGLTLFVKKTRTGRAMLAVSEDKGAAQMMGINVNKIVSVTFAIGSGLAAIAGVLLCSAYPTLMPTTGSLPGIKAFTAAVFGGILLGVIEILARAYISSELADAIVFGVLIVVLIFRPTGLLGKQIHEKV